MENVYYDCEFRFSSFGLIIQSIVKTRYIKKPLNADDSHQFFGICKQWSGNGVVSYYLAQYNPYTFDQAKKKTPRCLMTLESQPPSNKLSSLQLLKCSLLHVQWTLLFSPLE